ncbi:hypothetical protein Pcinc_025157 [Petrolisthes cinctipes]|uniref:Uncharacterized protein n=1 Tax=Petrolisthes cinctipes TaxID=88211 RepID=A0AAE1FB69_PETCI|nr:hypothetical protein Pcinc_025157 [Petrolisthes cinctipes]
MMWRDSPTVVLLWLLVVLVCTAFGSTNTNTNGFSHNQQQQHHEPRATTFLPYERGTHNTTHVFLSKATTLGLEENIDVYLPTEPGAHKMTDHMASHGMAVVVFWSLTLPLSNLEKLEILKRVFDWTDLNINRVLHNHGVSEDVTLDLQNILMACHSAGCQLTVDYLKEGCREVKGQALLSPVDGGLDGDGGVAFAITPGTTLNYATPSLVMPCGLDDVPSVGGFPCGPEHLSNARFYEALNPTSPRWGINATEFGHGDFLDPAFQHAIEAGNVCGWNHDATEEELDEYRRYIAGQLVTFHTALYTDTGDCSEYLPYLQDPGMMLVVTESVYQNPSGGCPMAGCMWSPPPPTTTTATTN